MRHITRILLAGLLLFAHLATGEDTGTTPDTTGIWDVWDQFTNATTTNTVMWVDPQPAEQHTTDLDQIVSSKLRTLHGIVERLKEEMREARASYARELAITGAAHFPEHFGKPGSLSLSDDYRRITWSSTPRCTPSRDALITRESPGIPPGNIISVYAVDATAN